MLEKEQARLEERKIQLNLVIRQRIELVDRIGKGQIQVGSSLENTLRIGKLRKRVRDHATQLEGRLSQVNEELNTFNSVEKARDYLSRIEKMKGQLGELSDLAAEGVIKPEELAVHQKEYENLKSLPSQDLTLRRAIEKIARIQGKEEKSQGERVEPRKEEEKRRREKTRGQKDRRPITYELPSGRQLRGKEGLLVKALARTQGRVSSNQLAKEIYPGLNRGYKKSRLQHNAYHVRKFLREEGLDILVVKDYKRGITYYSLRTIEKPKTVLAPAIDVSEELIEPKKEIVEIHGLSRTNIAVIASTLSIFKEDLSPFLEAAGISYIDNQTLKNLEEMGKDEEALQYLARLDSRELQPERTQFLNNLRLRSFDKARDIIKSPNLEQALDKAYQENPNVWALLFNLFEIDEIIEKLRQKEGISFIKELIELPRRKIILVNKDGSVILSQEDPAKTVGEPMPANEIIQKKKEEPLIIEKPTPEEIKVTQASDVQQKPVTQKVIEAVSSAASTIGEIVRQKSEEHKSGVEREDPKIRAKIHVILEAIEKRDEFRHPVNSAVVNKVFQRLKETSIEKYWHDRLIPVIPSGGKDRFLFTPVAIATALYLYDSGRNMSGRHKRQVQKIAQEVWELRQERKQTRNGK